ncbi:hypothetical protein JTE90_004042 [Oedothorax gibbosus]|uniref:Reverse transcriptase/retrotransposon-derived protein RNase H-like domain-containing protein n=1 Tax=Oedothorax gibbosus TaxID=931172 RepID=A0AAV6U6F0_9ARAC|nr:hypothetical protein JTE90_004042 [Oedothorax gibbosus]
MRKKRIVRPDKFERLPNVTSISSPRDENLLDMIREIVRQEIGKYFPHISSCQKEPEDLVTIIKEEVHNTLAPLTYESQSNTRNESSATDAVIDCGLGQIEIGEATTVSDESAQGNDRSILCAARDNVIPAHSIKRITVLAKTNCLTGVNYEDTVRDVVVSTATKIDGKREFSVPSAVITVSGGTGQLWVSNSSAFPLLIPSDMSIAQTTEIDECQIWSLNENADQVKPKPRIVTKELEKRLGPLLSDELNEEQREEMLNLLSEFIDVFDFEGKEVKSTSTVKHRINTGDSLPVRQRPYRVSHAEREVIQNEVEQMLQLGIVEPSESPWSSPVDPVLGYFNPTAETRIHTDASGYGIGGVLVQIQNGEEKPIATGPRFPLILSLLGPVGWSFAGGGCGYSGAPWLRRS